MQPTVGGPKRPYEAPRVVDLGTVGELTQVIKTFGESDGAFLDDTNVPLRNLSA